MWVAARPHWSLPASGEDGRLTGHHTRSVLLHRPLNQSSHLMSGLLQSYCHSSLYSRQIFPVSFLIYMLIAKCNYPSRLSPVHQLFIWDFFTSSNFSLLDLFLVKSISGCLATLVSCTEVRGGYTCLLYRGQGRLHRPLTTVTTNTNSHIYDCCSLSSLSICLPWPLFGISL